MWEHESCGEEEGDATTLDLSYRGMTSDELAEQAATRSEPCRRLLVTHNSLTSLPHAVSGLSSLRHLHLSHNSLSSLPDFLTDLPLVSLVASHNSLSESSLPKSLGPWSASLRTLHLGGNGLTRFPPQILDLVSLNYLHLGGNRIPELPPTINKITGLVVLCLGGNRLRGLPETLGSLRDLEVLALGDNAIEEVPASVANLTKLATLQLHRNAIKTLPRQIIALTCLTELSLRENPLVVKFVEEGMEREPARLLELAARAVRCHRVPYAGGRLPMTLVRYLDTAHHCVNPECNGVYFDSRVEHVKFVDFCGKYRIPLMQYLCSTKCASDENSPPSGSGGPGGSRTDSSLLRKVLLG